MCDGARSLPHKVRPVVEICKREYRAIVAEVNRKMCGQRYPDSAAVMYQLFCGTESPRDDFGVPFKLGLRPLGNDQVLIKDSNYAYDLNEKRRLMAENTGAVWQQLPESLTAQREALTHLFPTLKQRDDQAPLLTAGLQCQEDVVVMLPTTAGHILGAGSVCFPSSWRLVDKIGKPMAQVHAPVPGFQDGTRPARMIERLFTHMRPTQPMVRMNWSIVETNELHTPNAHERSIDIQQNWQSLWLRVERQTLSKLPKSQAVLFTIRIFLEPLAAFKAMANDQRWDAFLTQIATMTAAQKDYKGILS